MFETQKSRWIVFLVIFTAFFTLYFWSLGVPLVLVATVTTGVVVFTGLVFGGIYWVLKGK